MEASVEDLARYFPHYLTHPQRDTVAKELGNFPNVNFYLDRYHTQYLQGDCWGPIAINTATPPVAGVILSNSCDIDLENKRALPPSVVFSPLISIKSYRTQLERGGLNNQAIEAKLHDIRRQAVTDIIYFPPSVSVREESLIWLCKVFSVPMKRIAAVEKIKKSFTLSQVGFYIFTMKLAIHFCRLHENVPRFPDADAA